MDDRFVILTEYFRAAHKSRRKEINKSIEINCRIAQTKRVVIFIDPEVEFPPSLKLILSEEKAGRLATELSPVKTGLPSRSFPDKYPTPDKYPLGSRKTSPTTAKQLTGNENNSIQRTDRLINGQGSLLH